MNENSKTWKLLPISAIVYILSGVYIFSRYLLIMYFCDKKIKYKVLFTHQNEDCILNILHYVCKI